MPINTYTGLMGSGKSFEVVSQIILDAIAKGRNVVTNVDGIDGDAIQAYLHEKRGVSFEKMGKVRHCQNDDVLSSSFFPFGEDVDTFVRPGEMVCIDEAWRFWGTDKKLLNEHKIFFREHRHYVDQKTKVSCDLVLMVQDISDLHRVLKVVVELTFRTEKKKSLGLSNTYSVSMYEGYKINQKSRVGNWVRNYDKDIFPLYSSYSGGDGKELAIDKRQNIFRNPRLIALLIFMPLLVFVSGWRVYRFFKPVPVVSSAAVVSSGGSPSTVNAPVAPGRLNFSSSLRYAGTIQTHDGPVVLLMDDRGKVRLESPSLFTRIDGLSSFGHVDGALVTTFSGSSGSQSVVGGVK